MGGSTSNAETSRPVWQCDSCLWRLEGPEELDLERALCQCGNGNGRWRLLRSADAGQTAYRPQRPEGEER